MNENTGAKPMLAQELALTELPWSENPRKELMRLAIPMVASLLLTTVVNAFDTWIVGSEGPRELAAAGLGNTVAFTVSSFSLALFAAAKVKVGETIGRGEFHLLPASRRTYGTLALILGLLSIALSMGLAEVVHAISRDPMVGELGRSYLRLRSLALLPMILTAALAHHRQAEGAPRLPMQATLVASLIHVPLSAFLLHSSLGVLGVAVAYGISRSIELSVLVLGLRGELRVPSGTPLPRLSSVFRLGLTTAIERILDMAAFAMVPLLLSRKDPTSVAAHQVTLQLSQLSFLPLIALSEAVSILISQTQGSRVRGLAKRIAKDGYLWTFGYAALLASLFFAIPSQLVGLFSTDQDVVVEGANALQVAALLQLVNASYAVTKGVLRGLSRFDLVAWVAVACAWGVTPPLTYFLGVNRGLGAKGAWAALVVEVCLGLALLARVARKLLRSA